MRLNAYLARAGVASRRKADELIKSGRVKINDQPGQLNSEVTDSDVVRLDGRKINLQRPRYILLYKPERTVTTLSDPEGRPTILDDVKVPERVVPVGRLDFDTTGVLLLTNDGELAHKLMHPSFEIDKVYRAEVWGTITPEILNKLSNGVSLDGRKTSAAKVRKLNDSQIELIIHEGRYHQIKRMLEAVGLQVRKLHRSQYGPLNIDGLRPGQWRDLTEQEVKTLLA